MYLNYIDENSSSIASCPNESSNKMFNPSQKVSGAKVFEEFRLAQLI